MMVVMVVVIIVVVMMVVPMMMVVMPMVMMPLRHLNALGLGGRLGFPLGIESRGIAIALEGVSRRSATEATRNALATSSEDTTAAWAPAKGIVAPIAATSPITDLSICFLLQSAI